MASQAFGQANGWKADLLYCRRQTHYILIILSDDKWHIFWVRCGELKGGWPDHMSQYVGKIQLPVILLWWWWWKEWLKHTRRLNKGRIINANFGIPKTRFNAVIQENELEGRKSEMKSFWWSSKQYAKHMSIKWHSSCRGHESIMLLAHTRGCASNCRERRNNISK